VPSNPLQNHALLSVFYCLPERLIQPEIWALHVASNFLWRKIIILLLQLKLFVMKKMLLPVALCFAHFLHAQEDAENCKDHRFFNRLSNFVIESCSENFDAMDLTIAKEKTERKEGNITKMRYVFAKEDAKPPSKLQIVKNYENAIVAKGGKRIAADDLNEVYTFSMGNDGKQYYVTLDGFYGNGDGMTQYNLHVLEQEAMKQEIEAKEMFEKIVKDGSIALYINFETGKSVIKPESKKTVEQVAEMLKANPALRVSIEGHTDNTGTPAGNKTLSEARAKAVMQAVSAAGIAAARLSVKGWGQEKAVADNSTEEGKAKNRRVEIVKM
jgi:outer membrane protein OmpA-like peptidoglycan-associated protein